MKSWRFWTWESSREVDLERELQSDLEIEAEEQAEAGLPPEEARYAARRALGNTVQIKEDVRMACGFQRLETLLQDLRYGLRQLRRNPGFTVVAVITLALGIGSNSAMFSVVNAVLLRPLPFRDPGQLVVVDGIPAVKYNGLHNQVLGWQDWVSKTRSLADIAVYATGGINIAGNQQPEHLPAAAVSTNFFHLLGVGALRGRTFLPNEASPGRAVTVISYDLWRGQFGGDPYIVGRKIDVAGRPFTISGVMPPGFEFPGTTQIWVPEQQHTAFTLFGEQTIANWQIARLKPGVKPKQARDELLIFFRHLDQGHPASSNPKISVTPLHLTLVKNLRPSLLVLMTAVGLVLLIACVNIANLLMTRNAGRAHEVAIRSAVGASHGRLVRQLLTESVLLALMSGGAGLLVAEGGMRLARAFVPASHLGVAGIDLDTRVLIFTLVLTVLVGLLSGLLPAFGISRVQPSDALKGAVAAASVSGWLRGSRLRGALVSAEVALALILLAGAGLLIKSLAVLNEVNPGFRTDHVLCARLFLTEPGYSASASRIAFFDQVIDRAQKFPGVREAAFVNSVPMGSGVFVMFAVGVEGSTTPKPESSNKFALYFGASPEYFRAMGIPLLAGREFGEQDHAGSPPVVIVSQTAARDYWPNQSPIGKRITMVDPPKWMTVVGVVGDIRQWSLAEKTEPAIYLPVSQAPPASAFLVLHTSSRISAHDMAVVVHSVDRNEPLSYVRTGKELVSQTTSEPRFRATVLGIFAGLAMLLACVGIYGVVSYIVSRRTHEIGIRMALGANKRDVLRMVIGRGLKLSVIGVAVGIAGAWGLTRFLASLLYGVKPTDPLTFIAVSLILTGVALLACYIPARRAAKVDPMVALRHE